MLIRIRVFLNVGHISRSCLATLDWGWEGDNPCARNKEYKSQSRDRFLEGDELPKFFEALGEEPNTTARDYILASLLTGARRTNVLEMRWDQVNLERRE